MLGLPFPGGIYSALATIYVNILQVHLMVLLQSHREEVSDRSEVCMTEGSRREAGVVPVPQGELMPAEVVLRIW